VDVKVLLVSSGPRVTAQVTTALLGTDFTYTEVRTPQRALKVLEEDPSYDLILADCDTHPTGGFFLSREVRLRAADGHDMPPIVLLVARPQDEYLARWAEADAWVIKPVDPFDLAEAVEALVDRRPVPSLPGVSALSPDRSLDQRPKPPISTGADFRDWGEGGVDDTGATEHVGQDPLPTGEPPAGGGGAPTNQDQGKEQR
jgi:DNA-binding response OmpR family regulator